jgi:Flp pilus assembly protein TadD
MKRKNEAGATPAEQPMGKRKALRKSREERREEVLRPCPYLGYDHDQLGAYLMERGAFRIAEAEFRRAVWFNPYEASFKTHLAASLFWQGRCGEAKDWIAKALTQRPGDKEAERWRAKIEKELAQDNSGEKHS